MIFSAVIIRVQSIMKKKGMKLADVLQLFPVHVQVQASSFQLYKGEKVLICT